MTTKRDPCLSQVQLGSCAVATDMYVRLLDVRTLADLLPWTTKRLRANSLTHAGGGEGGVDYPSVSD